MSFYVVWVSCYVNSFFLADRHIKVKVSSTSIPTRGIIIHNKLSSKTEADLELRQFQSPYLGLTKLLK